MQFEDKILDNVHGFIELTHVECRIVDLPIFKRLRQLKQLSLADWVFPGAEHTRYIHSLGVMHIADKMAVKLEFNDVDRQIIRLAGLLHDLGHYPLSHVGESVYMNSKIIDDPLEEKRMSVKATIAKLGQMRVNDYMKQASNPKHHERITEKVILADEDLKQIISEECPEIDIQDICDIITGCVDRKPELSAHVQIMHSELDADRIDYIMRDGTFSGTSFGGFELGMLLDNLRIAKYDGVDIVGVTPKGISSADQFLINRFFSYSQIIFNKHVEILGFMANVWIEHCIKNNQMTKKKDLEEIINNHNHSSKYLTQTDAMFWSTLNTVEDIMDDDYVPDYIKRIANVLSNYGELEYLEDSEVKIISDNVEDVVDVFSKVNIAEDSIPLLEIRSITNHMPIEVYKERLKARFGSETEKEGLDEEYLQNALRSRMQEGIAVIDGDDVHLLVDDQRSLVASLCDTKLYLLRQYKLY